MADRAYITLYREPAWYERMNPIVCPLSVVLDNKKVETIYPDEEKLLYVQPGDHNLVVKPWLGAGSKKMAFGLTAGEEVFLDCGWSPSYIKGVSTFTSAALIVIALLFCSSLIVNTFNLGINSHICGLLLGVMICLFVLIWASGMVFGLIGLFKPGWIYYLQKTK
jgi:hypothetical protein